MATFSETSAFTSRIYVANKVWTFQNYPENKSYFGRTSPFLLYKSIKDNKFSGLLFTWKRTSGDHIGWNTCTYFQEICSRRRQNFPKPCKKHNFAFVALDFNCERFLLFKRILHWLLPVKLSVKFSKQTVTASKIQSIWSILIF